MENPRLPDPREKYREAADRTSGFTPPVNIAAKPAIADAGAFNVDQIGQWNARIFMTHSRSPADLKLTTDL